MEVNAVATIDDALDLERVMTIVIAAMSRPANDRCAFVAAACAHEPAVLSEVQRRVMWQERLGPFLLSPVIARMPVEQRFQSGELVNGRFRIRGVAGAGGMGTVYDAIDEKLVHRVALKCPKFEFRRKLSPEALSALRVTHPNVCRVFAIDTARTESGDLDFLTMEFVEGETLGAALATAPPHWLATREGRQIADQMLAGLRAAHEQHVIHRDLKPNNVMVSRDASGTPRAVIMDFGIAQAADIFSSQPRGTPAYVAPEIWEGRPATERSDIYSLGVLLYQMATSRLPFPEDANWTERLHREPELQSVPRPWAGIIAKCLSADPDRRFPSVAAIQAALQRSRWRPLVALGTAAAVAGLISIPVKEYFFPTSAVRIAVLPPSVDGGDSDKAVAFGFGHDLSYRLKTMRGSRRPRVVFALSESVAEHVTTSDQAASILGATHAIVTVFKRDADTMSVTAELVTVPGGHVLRRESSAPAAADPSEQLFTLQSRLIDGTSRALALRGESKVTTIPPVAYREYLRGMYYVREDFQNAAQGIPFMERVIALAPDSSVGYAGLAEALVNSEYMSRDVSVEAKAVDALAKAEQRDPESAQVMLISGFLNRRRGWLEQAIVDFQRAIERAPTDTEPRMALADAYGRMNQPVLAKSAFADAMAVEPGNYRPYLDAGVYAYQQGDAAEAERLFLDAVQRAPGQTRARVNLAELYGLQGRYVEQEEQTVAALTIRRTRDALVSMGALRERAGRLEEARDYYDEAIRVGPRYYPTFAPLAAVLQRLNLPDDARHTYQAGLEDTLDDLRLNPRDGTRLAWAAYYYAKLGNRDAARKFARQALDTDATGIEVRARIILADDAIGDLNAAFEVLTSSSGGVVEEIAHRPEVSEALRNDTRFDQLAR